ncbi:MAG: LysR family transcriptional regulator [Spongiibacteraceae bacterium]|nr:LysR family transcriptional regulator [Spongiibacteraceae bacterium]
MKNLSIEMLRSFVAVNEEGGFTAAAEKLGRTQPAISQQIKKLELLLDRSLLDREGANLELTFAGQALLRYATQMLSINDEAIGFFMNPAVSGRVRVGIPSEFATTLLPKIVSRFVKAYPDVTLEVTCDLSRHLLSDDQRQRYDLILALYDRASSRQRNFIKTDELVWVSAKSSRVQTGETLPLIAAPDGCIYRQRALRKLRQAKIPWRIVYTIPDLTGIQAAIEEGLGLTVLARSTVPKSLSINEHSSNLPALGSVAINLKVLNEGKNSAVQVLADFIKTSLL